MSPGGPHATATDAATIEAAMRSLSTIGATLADSYAALERRAARVELELERKVAELDRVTRHLEAVLDALPTGVVVGDDAGRVVRVNGAALAILGEREERLVGRRAPAPCDDAAPADEWRQREHEARDGGRRVLATRRSRVPSGGWVQILEDRTELVALSERLHALDKLAALGNMAGGIAHELRNPMHAAKGFATLLARRLEPGGKEHHWSRRIVEGLADAEAILASMLTLAAPEALVLETIEPAALLEEAVAAALEGRVDESAPCPWRVARSASAPPFLGDRVKLRQALRNLVANALAAQPAGGAVHVEARVEQDALVLGVADAGPGIPAELRAKVLDPFFTTRPEGTGLGLALVGTIAGLHGGRVAVDARRSPLGGADVALVLPLRLPRAD